MKMEKQAMEFQELSHLVSPVSTNQIKTRLWTHDVNAKYSSKSVYPSDQNKILWPEVLGASNNPAIVQKILKAQNQFSFLTFHYVKAADIHACFREQWSRWVIHED
jgi:hypothetical protein